MLLQSQTKTLSTLQTLLRRSGQGHLSEALEDLPDDQADAQIRRLQCVDWPALRSLYEAHREQRSSPGTIAANRDWKPLTDIIPMPSEAGDEAEWQAARELGQSVLAAGKVAAIVAAGGQGNRSGFRSPKGLLPIGPVSGKSLYQWCCEQVSTRSRQCGAVIPYIIMTSDATHYPTVDEFEEHRCFGLDENHVWFACQCDLPILDADTGRAMLTDEGTPAWSPDGHGGLLNALSRAELWDRLREQGIEYLFYHSIDNPLARICDPAFIGWHVQRQAQVSVKVVDRKSTHERIGVAIEADGRPHIVKTIDLPREVNHAVDEGGRNVHWAGNAGMYVFDRDFLENIATSSEGLPLRVSEKMMPWTAADGQLVEPSQPNALRLERFIIDAIPLADSALFVECDRSREFHPVKHSQGESSLQACQQNLVEMHRSWLQSAGVVVNTPVVEISPTLALGQEDLAGLFPAGYEVAAPTEITRSPCRI